MSEVDGTLVPENIRTQENQVEWMLTGERVLAYLSTFIGLLALALATVGLYGLASYTVMRRTGEIGLRIALGASPRGVLWTVMHDSLRFLGPGVFVGLMGAQLVARLASGVFFQLSATDLPTYSAITLLTIAVATLACLMPAWRAARTDPMAALRSE